MKSFRNPSELMKTLIALCVLCAYTYGLGIYSNAADSNSIYEIIVDDHISPSKDEIRYITLNCNQLHTIESFKWDRLY